MAARTKPGGRTRSACRLSTMNLDLLMLGDALLIQELGDLASVVSGELDVELAGALVLLDRAVAVELLR